MQLTTKIYNQKKSRFDIAGQKLSTTLQESSGLISEHLAKRILKYAKIEMFKLGFNVNRGHTDVEIETNDDHLPRSERSYTALFKNAYGGKIGLQGILTKNGYPIVHHGLIIQEKVKNNENS